MLSLLILLLFSPDFHVTTCIRAFKNQLPLNALILLIKSGLSLIQRLVVYWD